MASDQQTAGLMGYAIATLAILTVTTGAAFAGLHGSNWYSDEDYVQVNGRSQITSRSSICMRISEKVECRVRESSQPIYYLLECSRARRACDGVQSLILDSGAPSLVKVGFRISEWTRERISAIMTSTHPCIVTTLQIDLESKEVILTDTYTKSTDYPFCVPENIGRTETYKLEDYY